MAYDLKLSYASVRLGRSIATSSAPLDQEGKILCAVLEDGVEKAAVVATVAGSEKVLGFSTMADALPDITAGCEVVTCPTAPAALVVQLRAGNLVSGRVRVYDVTNAVNLTVDTTYAGTPGAGAVKVDLPTGRLKFAAGQSGSSIQANYLYELTMSQAKQLFGERFVNNRTLESTFSFTEVAAGIGELYTDQFDASKDYSSGALKLGDGGLITVGGAGPALAAEVVNVPSASNPMLGIRFKFTA
jgi:hypothetical protein